MNGSTMLTSQHKKVIKKGNAYSPGLLHLATETMNCHKNSWEGIRLGSMPWVSGPNTGCSPFCEGKAPPVLIYKI